MTAVTQGGPENGVVQSAEDKTRVANKTAAHQAAGQQQTAKRVWTRECVPGMGGPALAKGLKSNTHC